MIHFSGVKETKELDEMHPYPACGPTPEEVSAEAVPELNMAELEGRLLNSYSMFMRDLVRLKEGAAKLEKDDKKILLKKATRRLAVVQKVVQYVFGSVPKTDMDKQVKTIMMQVPMGM